MGRNSRYYNELRDLWTKGNLRKLPQENPLLLDMCSNDYLGINQDQKLYDQFYDKALPNKYKFSSSSSRLLSINSGIHAELEKLIAGLYIKEDCLVFNSGYHANIGLLSALAGKKDLIIADKLVHASIIDGATLSKADFLRYKHLDYKHLKSLLNQNREKYEHVFIVSESIFSMDGDIANISALVEIKEEYKCFLYIDEAHGLGVRGNNGLGCVEEQDVVAKADFIVGALGKAMASMGAFVVCDSIFRNYLVNFARPLIFSTCLPPVNIAWTKFIFEQLPDMHDRRAMLEQKSKQFSMLLNQKPESHIIPYIIGENEAAIDMSEELKKHGFNALPVRYPTVPMGTARLRFSLNANMKFEDIKPVWDIIKEHESSLDK